MKKKKEKRRKKKEEEVGLSSGEDEREKNINPEKDSPHSYRAAHSGPWRSHARDLRNRV